MTALVVEHVSRDFGATRIVDDLSFSVAAGEIVALVGASGAGKSTVARMVAGTLAVTTGAIRVDGALLTVPRTRDDARRVQLVTQHPRSALNRRHTVRHALRQPLRVHRIGASAAARDELVEAVLTEVGLAPALLDRLPAELSGGELARVTLARALLLDPPVLVLDEPTASLDASVKATVVNLLLDLRDDRGTAMLVVTHEHDVARHLADRVLALRAGRLDSEVRFA
jgi:ABC-type glutathione transport system ATPase component